MSCLHIYGTGERCGCDALPGSEFCEDHVPIPDGDEASELPSAYRLARRAGAAALLGLFLLQLWAGMRALYGL